ncbi:MAG: hypothetical protein ABEH88_09140 [Halobacteriales archaeon]
MTYEDPQDTDTQADPGTTPSLSGLADRVQRSQDRDSHASEDSVPVGSNGGSGPATAKTYEDSEFFFPAASPSDGAVQPEETPPAVTESIDGTALDRADESDGRLGPDAKTEAIIELTGDVQNLLLIRPPHSPADHEICANLLMPRDDPPEHLLLVTFEKSPDERLNILRGHLGTLPDSIAMLNVGDATRSGSTEIVTTTEDEGISVDNVSDSTDVQRLCLTINKHLSRWDGDGETAVCFNSLTALLDAVDSETVFRFLNVLLGRVRSGEVRAHYHMDHGTHDHQTLETYRPLFDEQLRVEEDGSVQIDR